MTVGTIKRKSRREHCILFVFNVKLSFQTALQKMGYIKSNTALTDFAGNLYVLFANKKCQTILARARHLMKAELYDTIRLAAGDGDSTLPWSAYIAKYVCIVSLW